MISEPKQNHPVTIPVFFGIEHGSLNVPIEHHPTIRYMVYNGYYKVMSNIPKMGQLPTPVESQSRHLKRGERNPHETTRFWATQGDRDPLYRSHHTKT